MILIHNKDFKSLVEQTDKSLVENGFTITPGAIAKLFTDIINKNIAGFYETLTVNHMQSFVTTATGEFLDSIGKLLNCDRLLEEKDEDFRKRITHQTLSLAKANETSIRLAALTCDGVEDVVLKKYSHGPGSFTVVPVTKDRGVNQISSVIQSLSDVSSFGEKVVVKMPILKLVKFNIGIVYAINIDDNEKQEIAMTVREEVIKYINSLRVGEPLIINELTQRIMQISEKIINYSCNSFKINNQLCLFINQGSRWDEKFAISPDSNSITVR
ncbi:MAG: baseplate J/gp47 family protein [Peptostreptococcaceae bacterium]